MVKATTVLEIAQNYRANEEKALDEGVHYE